MKCFSCLLILVSIGAVLSRIRNYGTKLERMLKGIGFEEVNVWASKARDLTEKCRQNGGFDEQKCLEKRNMEEILEETRCCQGIMMTLNLANLGPSYTREANHGIKRVRPKGPFPFPTDNLALFKDVFPYDDDEDDD